MGLPTGKSGVAVLVKGQERTEEQLGILKSYTRGVRNGLCFGIFVLDYLHYFCKKPASRRNIIRQEIHGSYWGD